MQTLVSLYGMGKAVAHGGTEWSALVWRQESSSEAELCGGKTGGSAEKLLRACLACLK